MVTGKTTTFRMLTGDESPTKGKIVAAGFDLATNLRQARQYIGYCPQVLLRQCGWVQVSLMWCGCSTMH
jgi:ABC-type Mn2+/Zn2+ transport system ATPase subunit